MTYEEYLDVMLDCIYIPRIRPTLEVIEEDYLG